MRDIDLIKRKVEEYERRIQRLKQIKIKLGSWNTEGFESEAHVIKSKLKDPKRVEEVEREFSELKRKIEETESELKRKIEETEWKRKEADRGYRETKDLIDKAKEFGCDIFEAEELLEDGERAINTGNYEEAIKMLKEAKKIIEEIKEKSKPEIRVKLSKETFQQGVWEVVSLEISNDGNAHAKDIEIEFSEEVKVKGLEIIERLDVGEKTELEVSFKSADVGERVPLEISTRFKDLEEKIYEETRTVNINVGGVKREVVKEKEIEIPIGKKELALTIERAIYDPCKRDFIEGQLPRMKEWINRYDPGAYWFALSIQNNTERAIEEWGIELETSAALKIKEAKIEGIEYEIPHEAHLGLFKISVPKEYGIVIPKGGAQRVYFKLRADKPKTTYEISGIFKSEITGDVPIRAKEFKYLCDTGVSPEAVKAELKKTFSEKDAARLALSFKTVQELDRMCDQEAKTEEYLDKLSVLKKYTEGFSDQFTKHLDDFSRFMKQEQLGYLDEEYKGKVRRFCTNLIDVWISEFLKG